MLKLYLERIRLQASVDKNGISYYNGFGQQKKKYFRKLGRFFVSGHEKSPLNSNG